MRGLLIKGVFAGSLLLLVVSFILFYLYISGAGNLLVINFDAIKGINFISKSGDVLNILLTATAINMINIILSATFLPRNRFIAHLMAFVSLFVSLLILITVSAIIAIN